MRLILFVVLAMEITSHLATTKKQRQWLVRDVLEEENIWKKFISSLKDLLRCVDIPGPHQVTLFLVHDIPPPWTMAAAVHGSNLPVMMKENATHGGSINVLSVLSLPGRSSNMSDFARHYAFTPSTNPIAVFIIVHLDCDDFHRQIFADISSEFYHKLGTNRVIHLCPNNDPYVYFSITQDPAETLWPVVGQSVADFCEDQRSEHTRTLQRDYSLEYLKGFRYDFILREQHIWRNRRGETQFGGRDYEFERLLLNYGMILLDPKKRPRADRFRRTESELMLPSRSYSTIRTRKYWEIEEYTVAVLQADEYLVVRKAQRIPFELVLLLPFDWQTWSTVGAMFVLFVLSWALVHRHRSLISSILSSYFQVIEMLITGGSSRIFFWTSQRMIALCAIFMNMLAGNTYTGLLLGYITIPQYYLELETVKDVVAATERLYVTRTYRARTDALSNLGKLQENIIFLQNISDRDRCVQDIVTTGKAVTCMNEHMYSVISRYRKYTEDGRIMLHKVKEPLYSPNYGSYTVPRNHVILSIINKLILCLWQSGLFEHWDAMLSYSLDVDGQRDIAHFREEDSEPLRMKQLSGPFILYIGGMSVAGIVFLLEQFRGRNVRVNPVLVPIRRICLLIRQRK